MIKVKGKVITYRDVNITVPLQDFFYSLDYFRRDVRLISLTNSTSASKRQVVSSSSFETGLCHSLTDEHCSLSLHASACSGISSSSKNFYAPQSKSISGEVLYCRFSWELNCNT